MKNLLKYFYSFTLKRSLNGNDESQASNNSQTDGSSQYTYVLIFIFCIFLISRITVDILDEIIIPRGDSYTYATGFFHFINSLRANGLAEAYPYTIGSLIWLPRILLTLFYPLITPSPGSIIAVNFILFALTLCLFLNIALKQKIIPQRALFITFLIALIPHNYNNIPLSLNSLMPGPLFLSCLILTVLCTANFVARPEDTKQATLAGLATSLLVLSRGNAAAYAPFIAIGALIIISYKWKFQNLPLRRVHIRNIFLASLLPTITLVFYLFHKFDALSQYYSVHAGLSEYPWSSIWVGFQWIAFNIPGALFTVNGTYFSPVLTPVLTIIVHSVVLITGWYSLKNLSKNSDVLNYIGLISFVSFYSIYLFSLITFGALYSDPHFRVIHPWLPLSACFTCSLFVLLTVLLSYKKNLTAPPLLTSFIPSFLTLAAILIFYKGFNHGLPSYEIQVRRDLQIPLYEKVVRPSDIKSFTRKFASEAKGKKVGWLIYGHNFNSALLKYYGAQIGIEPPTQLVGFKDEIHIWAGVPDPTLKVSKEKFREYLTWMASQSDYLVIPEHIDTFGTNTWPNAITYYRREISKFINSESLAPDYRVWAVVKSYYRTKCCPYRWRKSNILILKKSTTKISNEFLDKLPRTWGTNQQVLGRIFQNSLLVASRGQRAPNNKVVFNFVGEKWRYNILKINKYYFGVPHSAGKVGPDDFLSGRIDMIDGVIVRKRKDEVIEAIEKIENSKKIKRTVPQTQPPALKFLRIQGSYNILSFADLYYGVPHSAGKVGPDDFVSGSINKIDGVIVSKRKDEVIEAIEKIEKSKIWNLPKRLYLKLLQAF